MTVRLVVPGALAVDAGGRREIEFEFGGTTVTGLFDQVQKDLPTLERRLRDDQAEIRRHVTVYVDGNDIRTLAGLDTEVPDGAMVQIIAAASVG